MISFVSLRNVIFGAHLARFTNEPEKYAIAAAADAVTVIVITSNIRFLIRSKIAGGRDDDVHACSACSPLGWAGTIGGGGGGGARRVVVRAAGGGAPRTGCGKVAMRDGAA